MRSSGLGLSGSGSPCYPARGEQSRDLNSRSSAQGLTAVPPDSPRPLPALPSASLPPTLLQPCGPPPCTSNMPQDLCTDYSFCLECFSLQRPSWVSLPASFFFFALSKPFAIFRIDHRLCPHQIVFTSSTVIYQLLQTAKPTTGLGAQQVLSKSSLRDLGNESWKREGGSRPVHTGTLPVPDLGRSRATLGVEPPGRSPFILPHAPA